MKIPGWTDKKIHIDYQELYIYMSSSWLNILTISPRCASEFTGWAIIEELSIRRRLRTFLINWGQKTHMKHCNVDLSSWYELWFAIICIDMDLILDLSTAINSAITYQLTLSAHSRQSERQNIIDRMHTWQQCSVTISDDILTTIRLQSQIDFTATHR